MNTTPSRKVVVAYFLSLDGVAENPGWAMATWDDVTDASGEELIRTQDTVLMGRRTYDEWVGYWPSSDVEPFASFVNAAPKYVATSTPLDGDWAGTEAIDGDLVEFVRELKSRPGGDIGVHGSISVTRSLLAAGLVDELRFVIAPTIVGAGKRLLDDLPETRLELISSTGSPRGNLLAHYRVAVPAAASA
ncbi:dihydrofolate reductase family protein [Phycicoccus sp. KQZ13P-1]|uniref:dihydrofolate reductase family protein n=1 Tax=Phycicoccus mangrovi TaxID=2840470 RepID=UPI001C000554|nr:dihydrofolate reductase family protein [Phycicoccus mangrovi]MBT9256303.1 dihydrofolate reductase family protein [Phycicoccus mangrovi]